MKVLDMIWAEEAGVYIKILESDRERRVIEIYDDGKMGHNSKPVARATIADFRRKRVAEAFDREPKPNDSR